MAHRGAMVRSVLTAALRFRVLLAGVAAGLIVAGVLSLPSMHADTVPELASGPVLEVQTEASGLSSVEVEQYVTVPLENNLLDGIMDVWDMRSQSIPGLSTVDLYFEPGTPILSARQLVTERLTAAFELPNVSKPPLLIQPLSSTSRVLLIGLRSASVGPLELSYLARWVVKPRLLGVTGVANVAIFGERDRQIQVLVNPARLASHHVTLDQIVRTAGNAQLVSPLTFLEGSSPGTGGFLDGPNQRLDIRPVLPLSAPSDLASVPVTGAPKGTRLGDVTTVVEGNQPLIGDAIVGDGSGLVLEVQKLPSASAIGVTNGLERALTELRPALRGVQFTTSFFKPASYVSNSLHNLAVGLIIAAVLALVGLLALVLDLRALAVSAVSIALTLLAPVLLLHALGYTFNALVVLGLLVAGAVVVDDVVGATLQVAGAISRAQGSEGQGAPGAILDACAPLRSTLGYATFFVLLAIAPVFFADGLTATFVHPFVLTFALAVLASMVVGLTFTPALAWLLLGWGGPRPRAAAVRNRFAGLYRASLRLMLAVPASALNLVCLIGLAGLVALPFLEQPSQPRFLDRNLVVNWDGPAGASLPEMDRITRGAVSELRALPSVASTAAILGRAVSGDQIVDPSSGQIFVAVKPDANYDQAIGSIRAIVEETPGIQASVSTYESDVMNGVLASSAHNVIVRIYGENFATLHGLADQVQALMSHVKSLSPPQVALPAVQPNVEVSVNDRQALSAGVAAGDARREASTLISGLTVGNFFAKQAVFDVVVKGVPSVSSTVDDVRNLLLDTSGGRHIRLHSIADVGVHSDPIDIQHEALSRYVDVTARVDSGSVSAAQQAVRRGLRELSYPLSYHAEILGGNPFDGTAHVTFVSYILVALLGMLLLAQAAFGSWSLAVVFILTLPVALGGGILVALATGELRSLGTDAGLLAVLAIAARQGMLQIAAIRRIHAREGGSLTPPMVEEGAAQRIGPSLAGLALVALAMLPFVVEGNVAGNEIIHVAAAVILGGLLTSALLTQFALPALCLSLGRGGPPRPLDAQEEPEVDTPAMAPAAELAEPVAKGGSQ